MRLRTELNRIRIRIIFLFLLGRASQEAKRYKRLQRPQGAPRSRGARGSQRHQEAPNKTPRGPRGWLETALGRLQDGSEMAPRKWPNEIRRRIFCLILLVRTS